MADVSGSFYDESYSSNSTNSSLFLTESYSAPASNAGLFMGDITVTHITQSIIVLTGSGVITYYKRGYNSSLKQFEFWKSNFRVDTPPSGNPLIDVTILQELTG